MENLALLLLLLLNLQHIADYGIQLNRPGIISAGIPGTDVYVRTEKFRISLTLRIGVSQFRDHPFLMSLFVTLVTGPDGSG